MEVYLDNGATSYPKPEIVYETVDYFLRKIGTSVGRGCYPKALKAEEIVYNTREKLARLFNITDPKRIVFTHNATESLNLAIKGFLNNGDHVITSSMEHLALWRPLKRIEKEKDVEVNYLQCSSEGEINVADIRNAIKPNTKLIALLHASNVTGSLFPIEEIGKIAKENDIYFLVDSSQSAGAYSIDVQRFNIDLLAFTGHKCLLGLQGTGGLYISPRVSLTPLKEGGVGGYTLLEGQPNVLPERFEAGTLNVVGIAGLNAGISYILEKGIDKIRKHKEEMISYFLGELKRIENIIIYGPLNPQNKVGVISINIQGQKPSEVGKILGEKYGIAVRTGLHCAPWAHQTIGTLETGTVRFSLGYFNTKKELDYTLEVLEKITNPLFF